MADIVVVGQVGRDLVLAVDALPEPGGAAPVRRRREMLGGKGANQAVACAQLGASVGLVGVVGADAPGRSVLHQAADDGIDVTGVVVRDGAATALLVDVVEAGGTRRLLEDVPDGVLLSREDVAAAGAALRRARTVLVQLQQPPEAVLEALRVVQDAGRVVVVDGAAQDPAVRRAVLRTATVLRADSAEASLMVGRELAGAPDVLDAAQELRAGGPAVVALAAGSDGNVVVWDGGHVVMPLLGGRPADPTGAGDAFVAALAVALHRGLDAETAAWWASAAAALTVDHVGGRPDLSRDAVERLAASGRGPTG